MLLLLLLHYYVPSAQVILNYIDQMYYAGSHFKVIVLNSLDW